VHTYGIIKIKVSLHHTIAKLEHYFTIAFSGAFPGLFQCEACDDIVKINFSGNFRFKHRHLFH
jgi:hypothetical protein